MGWRFFKDWKLNVKTYTPFTERGKLFAEQLVPIVPITSPISEREPEEMRYGATLAHPRRAPDDKDRIRHGRYFKRAGKGGRGMGPR